ncbi:hypothetical protein D3C81_1654750 [compost metagenome]
MVRPPARYDRGLPCHLQPGSGASTLQSAFKTKNPQAYAVFDPPEGSVSGANSRTCRTVGFQGSSSA